jgi:YbbR domain-containing protein
MPCLFYIVCTAPLPSPTGNAARRLETDQIRIATHANIDLISSDTATESIPEPAPESLTVTIKIESESDVNNNNTNNNTNNHDAQIQSDSESEYDAVSIH